MDILYLVLIVLMLLSLGVSGMVKSRFNRYEKTPAKMTGAQAAKRILMAHGIIDVPINVISGTLSDNYDPRNRCLNLSQAVAYGQNISAISVAAHECGHAIQHQEAYAPLTVRKTIVPVANICSSFSYIAIILGMFLDIAGLIEVGIVLFSLIVLVHLVTLPVELNASRRALNELRELNIIDDPRDLAKGRKVLTAAAMTYILALISVIVQLLRLISIAKRRD